MIFTNGYAHISVIDTGIGIPIEAQNKLFKINEHYTTIGQIKKLVQVWD
jgi:signal transduction histidine kinase